MIVPTSPLLNTTNNPRHAYPGSPIQKRMKRRMSQSDSISLEADKTQCEGHGWQLKVMTPGKARGLSL